MVNKMKVQKNTPKSSPHATAARQGRKVAAKKAPSPVRVKAIAGLKGKGLLSFGDKSKLELRDVLAMTRPMFARIVDVSERTVADAESGIWCSVADGYARLSSPRPLLLQVDAPSI